MSSSKPGADIHATIDLIEMRSKSDPTKITRKLNWSFKKIMLRPWPLLIVEKNGTENFLEAERVASITIGGDRHELPAGVSADAAAKAIEKIFDAPAVRNWSHLVSPDFTEDTVCDERKTNLTVPIVGGEARRSYITYRDAKGQASGRVIVPLAVQGRISLGPRSFSVTHIDARCETKKAKRTFRVDRIEEIADFETGEVMTLTTWASRLNLDETEIARGLQIAERLDAQAREQAELEEVQFRQWRRDRTMRKAIKWAVVVIVAILLYRHFVR